MISPGGAYDDADDDDAGALPVLDDLQFDLNDLPPLVGLEGPSNDFLSSQQVDGNKVALIFKHFYNELSAGISLSLFSSY